RHARTGQPARHDTAVAGAPTAWRPREPGPSGPCQGPAGNAAEGAPPGTLEPAVRFQEVDLMFRSIAVGLDGSLQSRAAAEWAAREAELWQLPLRLVHVWEPVPEPVAEVAHLTPEKLRRWSEQIPRQVADGLRSRHRELDVRVESVPGSPMDVLPRVAKETELLVLGSRGLSGLGGFLVGSVGMYVIGHTEAPVVLVRAVAGADGEERERASSAGAARLPVVLGIDTRHPDDAVIAFAFEEAARRGTAVRAVHAWTLPAHYAFALP